MRILITGSRTWGIPQRALAPDVAIARAGREKAAEIIALASVLAELREEAAWIADLGVTPDTELVVVHGDAKGADTIAKRWARKHARDGVVEEAHPADWRPTGVFDRRAGIKRNQKMVDLGADLVLAFSAEPITPGTAHCVQAAQKAGITVRRIYG